MYSILIVDDDASARRGLGKCIDWRKMNAEVVGFAQNGREALEFVEAHPVDIVLSDVCMPGMDGTQLSRILHERYPSIQILLISGYGEVGYLKTALDVCAVNYILKPVKIAELEASVERAVRLIEEGRARNEKLERLRRSMPMLRERFLTQLLEGTLEDREEILSQAAFFEVELRAESYCVLLVSAVGRAASPMEAQLHQMELLEELTTFSQRSGRRGCAVPVGDRSSALIDMDDENRAGFAEELLEHLRAALRCEVDVGFGCEVRQVERLPFSLSVARQAMDQAYFEGHNRIFSAQPHLYETDEARTCWDGGAYLTGALYRSEQDVRDYIDSVFREMRQSAPARAIQAVAQRMLLTAIQLLLDCGRPSDMPQRAAALMARLSQFDTVGEMQDAVWAFMRELYALLNSENKSVRQRLIAQIRDYMDEHYMENLTARRIAEAMHYSAAYLTALFRSETGLTMNEALTERRMRAAAELLRTTDLRVYEVAQRVGYADVKYFSQLFRRAYNMQPSEYHA